MATDEPLELLPCAICARTFKPQSLEKHTKICERSAIKKRKPFDSAKQRIQGTELAEFLPKETSKRKVYQTEDKTNCDKGSWKQTHDEFLRAIRAARGETIEAPRVHQSPASNVTIGVPTRPNEKGMCPTCNRKFSIKSYERHVEWCKDRAAKVPMSAATNIAKERLEARMKYRAPALKNRRASVRDKYSPSSATHLASLTSQKINNGNFSNQRAKETVSTPNCHEKIGHENPTGNNQPQKSTANTRRTGQGRDGITSGPMKSRLSDRSNRIFDRDSRAVWSKYVRRHPDFNLVLTGRTGSCAEYDPFLIAERQMNELLSDTCSEKSIITDLSSNRRRSSLSPTLPNYPLTHSSAFVKYGGDSPVVKIGKLPEKRVSLIAPPTEFDDFSSDSTETNSISREIKNGYNTNSRSRDACHENDEARRKNVGRDHVLGRRVIIDKSKALGVKDIYDDTASIRSLMENSSGNGKVRKLFEKKTSPKVNRSNSVRTNSSPKTNVKKINNSDNSPNDKLNNIQNHRNNNYPSLSGSNVSLSSIVSSDVDVKRSHSAFDELASSCDDDTSPIYPSLTYLLKNDSLSITSPVQSNRPRNGQISDEEFSSPDSYKRHHEHNKLSADSAYSSLNRKYSNHGRGTNEMAGRHEEDSPLHRRELEIVGSITRSKLSRFCHECGSKFPETAKFCCECGIKRLAL